MVSAIWLAMQNTSCVGMSGRALSEVTVRVAGRARPGGTRRPVPRGGVTTQAPQLGMPAASGPSWGDQLQIPAGLQHRRAISFIAAPVWLPKLPASLGQPGSWELQVILGFFSVGKKGK